MPRIYYLNGETFLNTGFYNANGFLTGGGKQIGFTITLPKSLIQINTITVNKLSCIIRGIGGYLTESTFGFTISSEEIRGGKGNNCSLR